MHWMGNTASGLAASSGVMKRLSTIVIRQGRWGRLPGLPLLPKRIEGLMK